MPNRLLIAADNRDNDWLRMISPSTRNALVRCFSLSGSAARRKKVVRFSEL